MFHTDKEESLGNDLPRVPEELEGSGDFSRRDLSSARNWSSNQERNSRTNRNFQDFWHKSPGSKRQQTLTSLTGVKPQGKLH